MNEDNPLVAAMMRAKPDKQNTIMVSLPGMSVGQPVELSVTGVVRSMTEDGKCEVEVQDVQPQSQEPEMVMTQESQVPG